MAAGENEIIPILLPACRANRRAIGRLAVTILVFPVWLVLMAALSPAVAERTADGQTGLEMICASGLADTGGGEQKSVGTPKIDCHLCGSECGIQCNKALASRPAYDDQRKANTAPVFAVVRAGYRNAWTLRCHGPRAPPIV